MENWTNAALDCNLHLALEKDTCQYTFRELSQGCLFYLNLFFLILHLFCYYGSLMDESEMGLFSDLELCLEATGLELRNLYELVKPPPLLAVKYL